MLRANDVVLEQYRTLRFLPFKDKIHCWLVVIDFTDYNNLIHMLLHYSVIFIYLCTTAGLVYWHPDCLIDSCK